MLAALVDTLGEIAERLPLVFPIHPRTQNRMADLNLQFASQNVRLIEPIGYLDFLALQKHAAVVVTDSGGVQEETTYLGVPCITVRENTERPVTVTEGTNVLIGQDLDRLREQVESILAGQASEGRRPALWDGSASKRIAEVIGRVFSITSPATNSETE
jgi:UDP-N-acetylglucosamine 2-epimerase (non-hydrolysing)